MKPDLNLNKNLDNVSDEVKEFMKSFYRNENKEFFEKDVNLDYFKMDLDYALKKGNEYFLNELTLAMKNHKKSILEELLKTHQTAEHNNISDDYLEGCKHTTNRIIVDLQQKLLGLL